MNTLESRNALFRILRLPNVLPKLREGHSAPRARLDRGPQVPRAQEAEVGAVLHEGGADRFRLRREQARADKAIEKLGFGTPELDGERRFHSEITVSS